MTGPELRRARLALGVDRAELAAVARVSVWCVKTLELGTRAGSPATWKRVECALRVAAADRDIAAIDVTEALTS